MKGVFFESQIVLPDRCDVPFFYLLIRERCVTKKIYYLGFVSVRPKMSQQILVSKIHSRLGPFAHLMTIDICFCTGTTKKLHYLLIFWLLGHLGASALKIGHTRNHTRRDLFDGSTLLKPK